MNNRTLSIWLKRYATYQKELEKDNSSKKTNRILKVSGENFREMVQSKQSFTIGSEQRFTHAMRNISIKDFAEELPVSIPSAKYYSSHWQQGVMYHLLKSEMIPPTYIVTSAVELGGKFYSDDSSEKLISYPCGNTIYNCTFRAPLSIGYLNSKNYIKFYNCTFEHPCSTSNANINSIEFKDCVFKSLHTGFFDSKIKTVTFENCLLDNLNFSSNESFFIESIVLKNVVINSLNINKNKFGSLIMSNLSCSTFNFTPFLYGQNNENDDKITAFDLIDIQVSEKSSKSFILHSIKSNKLKISGSLKDQMILIKDYVTEHLEVVNFTNEGKMKLHNVSISNKGTGLISNSLLGKAELTSVDFSQASHFQIYLSNLTEIITTNAYFPNKISGKSQNDYMEIREVFRQLKFAASKQGDRIKELEYEKLEMKAYEKTLKGYKDLPDKIILWTNKITNDHGQSWTRAAGLFLLLTIPMYLLIKYSLGFGIVWGLPSSKDCYQYLASSLNPIHDFDKVFKGDFEGNTDETFAARLLDTLYKVLSGYLIFQFLRAFRKYVK